MGSVHGEELPYLFGAPLVEGLGHFPKDYTKSEVALSEAFIFYIANFATNGSRRSINLLDKNSEVLIKELIAEDSSGSEIDDVGDDFIPEVSDHETETDTDLSDTEASTQQPLIQIENSRSSSSEDENLPLSRLSSFRGKNRYKNPNEVQLQESVLPISRERNKFKSILWDEYNILHQKYLEIGMKPVMKNHYRTHQLSVWLRLIPEIHRAEMRDVVAKYNFFRNHNDPELYDGLVRPDPLMRPSYYDPTLELYRKPYNVTLDIPSTIMETYVTTCISVMSARPGSAVTQNQAPNNSQDASNLEAAGYTAYSTALSITIAIGCSLLILNVLIIAGVYY
ncbi:unnamed protein product [Parnassius apollo]|uniref:(apollo) hypothetical protein n=1 Tax=Parnassius apollo TaxID=110799 RepID=A0A8S3Y3T1_PARAO|nr:unnamed protein product [Parnassius apollo]